MSRCMACNKPLTRSLGHFTLEDGTVIEETICASCRESAFSEYSYFDKDYDHPELSGDTSSLTSNGVTQPKKLND